MEQHSYWIYRDTLRPGCFHSSSRTMVEDAARKAYGPMLVGRVVISYEQAPEWIATLDSYDGPESPLGHGSTRDQAIDMLLLAIETRYEIRVRKEQQ